MLDQLKRELSDATIFIRNQTPTLPKIGITLGSGLSAFADQLSDAIQIPYSKIPHFAPPTVEGHGGQLVIGKVGKVPVFVLQGRVHFYEGHDMHRVVFATRVLGQLGVKNLILTNASGGLDPRMLPGDFMIIRDHVNLTGQNPLRGPNMDSLGPRFPDMSDPYDSEMRIPLRKIMTEVGARFSEGVYAGVTGPTYETAAEVRYLQAIGCQAVGMSTVAETIAARHMGVKVAGIACITNLATGLSSQQITHEEVKIIAKKSEAAFAKTLNRFVEVLGEQSL